MCMWGRHYVPFTYSDLIHCSYKPIGSCCIEHIHPKVINRLNFNDFLATIRTNCELLARLLMRLINVMSCNGFDISLKRQLGGFCIFSLIFCLQYMLPVFLGFITIYNNSTH